MNPNQDDTEVNERDTEDRVIRKMAVSSLALLHQRLSERLVECKADREAKRMAFNDADTRMRALMSAVDRLEEAMQAAKGEYIIPF